MITVAYLCLEYAIENNLPIYAGGLGVLAGDLVLEAGQQLKPLGLSQHNLNCVLMVVV